MQDIKNPSDNPRPSILVADDEESIRQVLRAQLGGRGYLVYEAGTGGEVLQKVPLLRPDVILLDLGLPDMDGIEVTQRLRRLTQAPIMILSVHTAESDKIAALEAGADDYLTKPCHSNELLERIRAGLLRRTIADARVFQSGDLAVDLEARMVQIGDRAIQLTSVEYGVLKVLVLNAGRLLTQRRLIHDVWGERHASNALQMLRATIGSLRQKLEVNPARPRHIATEPGVGFRLRMEA